MIYITGDTHIPIDIHKLNVRHFPEQKQLTKQDYLIICGDFGGVWDGSAEENYWLKWLSQKRFTTLFVDGNHENHKTLNEYPVIEYHGGKAHRILNMYHLMRGQVFTLDNLKFFTMGGASSHDKEHRKEGVSWWPEELPSNSEYDEAIQNLDRHDWTVDYVISHCVADSIQKRISDYYEHDKLTNFLEVIIKQDLRYKHWYFGHYHEDKVIDEKHTCLYDRIIKI